MKKILLFLAAIISISAPVLAQDTEGTFDHPMFPTRMTNYIRTEYSTNFDAVVLLLLSAKNFQCRNNTGPSPPSEQRAVSNRLPLKII